MNITIKSKKYGTHTFWMSSNGGAVCYGEDSLGAQICERGGFTGKTISCNPDYFRAVCYEWLRARAKNSADNQSTNAAPVDNSKIINVKIVKDAEYNENGVLVKHILKSVTKNFYSEVDLTDFIGLYDDDFEHYADHLMDNIMHQIQYASNVCNKKYIVKFEWDEDFVDVFKIEPIEND